MDITDFFVDDSTDKIGGITRYKLTDLANTEWKNFAIYTVESRAIPNMIDGLKPVQRFYLYSSIKNTPKDFKKVESVGGQLPDYGYNHGTTSGQAAGQLMAAEWANNVRFIEGEGSFGTRLVQQAAAPRYTKTRLHPNFHRFVKDIDIAPVNSDPEHLPPSFYIPIVPLVLANGVRGIATGFATNILPRDVGDLVEACREYITTGDVKTKLRIKMPQFRGVVEEEEGRFVCKGVFSRKGKTSIVIEEVPYSFTREEYIEVLNDLEDRDLIVGYDDLCDKNGFKFEVRLKLLTSSKWSDDEIIKHFKLSKPYTENITVIDHEGKLREYGTDAVALLKDFCDYRMSVMTSRIAKRISECNEEMRWLTAKYEFIEAILDEKIVFKGRGRDLIKRDILTLTSGIELDVPRLLALNIGSLTKEMVASAKKDIADEKKRLTEWKKTTEKKEFTNDLDDLAKVV